MVDSSGSGAQFCTVPTDRTINICYPLADNNTGALFQLQARARWDNNIITHMRVYVDNLPAFDEDTPADGYINPVMQVSAGMHTIVIVAWNIKGETIVSPALTATFFN